MASIDTSAPLMSIPVQKGRNSGDLVRFLVDRFLAQHQPAGGGERGYQMQGLLAAPSIVAAPRSLTVDGYQVGAVGPAFGNP